MARLQRLHVRSGIYYVELRVNGGFVLFPQDSDQDTFESMVLAALRQAEAGLHAYAWLPMSAYFVMQVADVPLGRIIQSIAAPYSRWLNRRLGQTGHRFRHPYRSMLLQSDGDVLDVVKHIHLLALQDPAGAGALRATSSHGAYLGEAAAPWLTLEMVRNSLGARGGSDNSKYLQLMQATGSHLAVQDLRRKHQLALRESKDSAIEQWLSGRAPPPRPSLQDLAAAIAYRLHLDVDDLCSISRRRDLALARAVVAWYATTGHVATLGEVARFFNRDVSTLSVGIARHRQQRLDLFRRSLADFLGVGDSVDA